MTPLIKKYEAYRENILWHIKTNKPIGEELNRCNERLSDFNEVIRDLSEYLRQSSCGMKWVKASERIWEYGKPTIVRYDGQVSIATAHNITWCVPLDTIEWLDESPESSCSLCIKYREALRAIQEISIEEDDPDFAEINGLASDALK